MAANFTVSINPNLEIRVPVSAPAVASVNVIATGPRGPRGLVAETFIFEQGVAAKTWNVVHNRDGFPSVTTVDETGTVIQGIVRYIDSFNIEITFLEDSVGNVYLN